MHGRPDRLEGRVVDEASRALGTEGTTETVRAALENTVRDARLRRLAARRLPDDFPRQLEQLRVPRSFET
jgi:hypothetical protein